MIIGGKTHGAVGSFGAAKVPQHHGLFYGLLMKVSSNKVAHLGFGVSRILHDDGVFRIPQVIELKLHTLDDLSTTRVEVCFGLGQLENVLDPVFFHGWCLFIYLTRDIKSFKEASDLSLLARRLITTTFPLT
jgi:hypothetical protein